MTEFHAQYTGAVEDHLYPDLYDLFDGAVVAAAVVAVFHKGYACVVMTEILVFHGFPHLCQDLIHFGCVAVEPLKSRRLLGRRLLGLLGRCLSRRLFRRLLVTLHVASMRMKRV